MSEQLLSDEISVVIQGQLSHQTVELIKSVKKYLQKAEIIVSTWCGQDLNCIDYCSVDKLIVNEDPGAFVFNACENKLNNLNRIIKSSQEGIRCATRKYVLRIRSDLILTSNAILFSKDKLPCRDRHNSLFEKRILACDTFSLKIDYRRFNQMRMLFHVSDWLHFGLKSDLMELFNIPFVLEPSFTEFYKSHKKSYKDIFPNRTWRMSPEQYITSENARKIFNNMTFSEYSKFSLSDVEISEMFIINNFCIFPLRSLGFEIQKGLYKNIVMRDVFLPYMYYSESEQQRDCAKYVNANSKVVDEKLLDIPIRSARPYLHWLCTEIRHRNFYWKRVLAIPLCAVLYAAEMLINLSQNFFEKFKKILKSYNSQPQ